VAQVTKPNHVINRQDHCLSIHHSTSRCRDVQEHFTANTSLSPPNLTSHLPNLRFASVDPTTMPFMIDAPPASTSASTNAALTMATASTSESSPAFCDLSVEQMRAQMRAQLRAEREERAQRLQTKNRRKRYLELHPEYFGKELELANPVLYDRLIRRFMTAAERQEEGQQRNFSDVLTMDHLRSEAREEALNRPNPFSMFDIARGPDGDVLPEEPDDVPESKEEGMEWWIDEMTQRFLRGDDKYFDYKTVDENSRYDDPEEERDIQDAYFDSMSASWSGSERELEGETGIQDF